MVHVEESAGERGCALAVMGLGWVGVTVGFTLIDGALTKGEALLIVGSLVAAVALVVVGVRWRPRSPFDEAAEFVPLGEGESIELLVPMGWVDLQTGGFLIVTGSRVGLLERRGSVRRWVTLGDRGEVRVVPPSPEELARLEVPFWARDAEAPRPSCMALRVGERGVLVARVPTGLFGDVARVLGEGDRPEEAAPYAPEWSAPLGREVVRDDAGGTPGLRCGFGVAGVWVLGTATVGSAVHMAEVGLAVWLLYTWERAWSDAGLRGRVFGALAALVGCHVALLGGILSERFGMFDGGRLGEAWVHVGWIVSGEAYAELTGVLFGAALGWGAWVALRLRVGSVLPGFAVAFGGVAFGRLGVGVWVSWALSGLVVCGVVGLVASLVEATERWGRGRGRYRRGPGWDEVWVDVVEGREEP